MIDLDTRTAVLRLHHEGHGTRAIAHALDISRGAVKRVLRSGKPEVPYLDREEMLAPHLDRIRQLHQSCEGNRVRVVEELAAEGIEVPYSTLTGFCRRYGIGVKQKQPAGHYHFSPAEEMQHDTSPHTVTIATQRRNLHCASLVLCYSRMISAQLYPRFSRFECKVFLTEALRTLGGAARRCMIDNSSVILAGGSGKNAVIAPEMEAFATRFGFEFMAHEVGHANRSGRVERPFHYIEHNFYPGRTFASLEDANTQLRAWCERVNHSPKRALGVAPHELFAQEKPNLKPLPLFIPEVYLLHERRADVDGFISLHTNRYSVPAQVIGRRLSVRESAQRIRIFDGHLLLAEHQRQEPGAHRTLLLDHHREPGRFKRPPAPPLAEERKLRTVAPELEKLLDRLRAHHGGQAARAVRGLYRLYLDYPLPVLLDAISTALGYDLIDLARIERIVLRKIAGNFFTLSPDDENDADE